MSRRPPAPSNGFARCAASRSSVTIEPVIVLDGAGHVAINRRGDAVVAYRIKDDTPQLWARYKPAGQPWTEPIEATAEATGPQRAFRAAIGPSGHAAIAWVAPNFHQLYLIRMAPAR